MKILITWLGFKEDFIETGKSFQFNPSGFTGNIQGDILDEYNFNKHVILYTNDRSESIRHELNSKKYQIKEFLEDQYPNHQFELADTGIDKTDLQNFPVIESSLRSFLQKFDATDELHVIAGTGPTSVSMAWCTLNLAMKDRFKLHVLQKKEYTSDGKKSNLKEVNPYISELLDDKLREHHINLNIPKDIYNDDIVEQEYKKAMAFAQAIDMNVLILGETGCGKDKMAEFIVRESPLPIEKYRPINCASLPDELLYSELFGHVKGAFTGAIADRNGLFEECNGGTLFLDEIGDISPFMQQSLLRAIDNQQIKKAGSNKIEQNIKVRIIAATNINLYEKCKAGKFRWDLYYRLSNPEIVLQSYRSRTAKERKNVIQHYIAILEKKWGRKISFSKDALKVIEGYSFPGNFREIYNTINSLFPLRLDVISPEDLPERFMDTEAEMDEAYKTAMKKHCIFIYEKYKFDLAATRKALGYENSTQLKNKLIEWNVYQETL